MFDIGFLELLLIGIVMLLVVGPERLPGVARTCGLWFGRLRNSLQDFRASLEEEIGMDEVRRELHNESMMQDTQRAAREVQKLQDDLNFRE